mmetsp:Transcript_5426/g.14569  ORF Transcript_5426/g.14569 Transcript_5426/m.14569 type:complete len:235 (-) Transcript_5426:33-737(-)
MAGVEDARDAASVVAEPEEVARVNELVESGNESGALAVLEPLLLRNGDALQLWRRASRCRDREEATSTLILAAHGGLSGVVSVLLQAGAPVDAVSLPRRHTALHLAAMRGHRQAVELLLAFHANVNMKDSNHLTPLHTCMAAGCDRIAEVLLRSGSDIDAVDKDGNAPLHYAVLIRKARMVRVLLLYGADTNLRNHCGHTARDMAEQQRYRPLVDEFSRFERARHARQKQILLR